MFMHSALSALTSSWARTARPLDIHHALFVGSDIMRVKVERRQWSLHRYSRSEEQLRNCVRRTRC